MHQPDAYSPRGVREAASTALQNLALQDLAALAFHVYMLLRVSVAPHGADRDMAIKYGVALLSATAAALLIARGEVVTVNGRYGIRVVDVANAEAMMAGVERRN